MVKSVSAAFFSMARSTCFVSGVENDLIVWDIVGRLVSVE